MSNDDEIRYSFDSSALIYAWSEAYPIESFESFWDRFDEMVNGGHALISEEVYEELGRKEDGLFEWVKQRPQIIVPHSDEVQAAVTTILGSHPLLIKARKNRSGGDPFVIAVAMCHHCTVVTQEGFGSENAPRIPNVCRAYEIGYQPLKEVIREQRWRF
jgi:uncharacterized protein DUF4411